MTRYDASLFQMFPLRICFSFVVCVLAACASPYGAIAQEQLIPYEAGTGFPVKLGYGLDPRNPGWSPADSPFASDDFAPPVLEMKLEGGEEESSIVLSNRQFRRATHTTGTLEVSYFTATGRASVDAVTSYAADSTQLTLQRTLHRRMGSRHLKSAGLKPEAAALVARPDRELAYKQFVSKYGPQLVTQAEYQLDVTCIFSFESSDAEQSSRLSQRYSAEASGGSWSAKASGGGDSATSEAFKLGKFNVRVYYTGNARPETGPTFGVLSTIDEYSAFIKSVDYWCKSLKPGDAAPIRYYVTTAASLFGMQPAELLPDEIDGAYDLYLDAAYKEARLARIRQAREAGTGYLFVPDQAAATLRDEERQCRAAKRAWSKYIKDRLAGKDVDLPTVEEVDVEFPSLRLTIDTAGDVGGMASYDIKVVGTTPELIRVRRHTGYASMVANLVPELGTNGDIRFRDGLDTRDPVIFGAEPPYLLVTDLNSNIILRRTLGKPQ